MKYLMLQIPISDNWSILYLNYIENSKKINLDFGNEIPAILDFSI
jgi:hypothetical protein